MAKARSIELIRVDAVQVTNPRLRNRRLFKEVVASVAELGLKRPITVKKLSATSYGLICGQGRLEAYQALGQKMIPAFIVDATDEDSAIMSLVENCARRQHRAVDLLQDIEGLRQRGYEHDEIARKTGLSLDYVKGVSALLQTGEQRLLRAVESGDLPISVALLISQASDSEVQHVLQLAYEQKVLRGRRLLAAKRLIEQRRRTGKGFKRGPKQVDGSRITSQALLRAYKQDVDRKRVLIRKSNVTRERLVFILEALRKLLADPAFVDMLKVEKLETLPQNVALRLNSVS